MYNSRSEFAPSVLIWIRKNSIFSSARDWYRVIKGIKWWTYRRFPALVLPSQLHCWELSVTCSTQKERTLLRKTILHRRTKQRYVCDSNLEYKKYVIFHLFLQFSYSSSNAPLRLRGLYLIRLILDGMHWVLRWCWFTRKDSSSIGLLLSGDHAVAVSNHE